MHLAVRMLRKKGEVWSHYLIHQARVASWHWFWGMQRFWECALEVWRLWLRNVTTFRKNVKKYLWYSRDQWKGPIKGTNQRDQSKGTNQRDKSIGQLNDVQSLIKLIVIMLRFKENLMYISCWVMLAIYRCWLNELKFCFLLCKVFSQVQILVKTVEEDLFY